MNFFVIKKSIIKVQRQSFYEFHNNAMPIMIYRLWNRKAIFIKYLKVKIKYYNISKKTLILQIIKINIIIKLF
jgi:hypothetical protein